MDAPGITDASSNNTRLAERRRNRELFRAVNERVAARSTTDVFQLLCECGEPACVDGTDIPVRQFRRVRLFPGWFVVLAGHEARAGSRVVERHGAWCVEVAPD
jgi:hypothetical protein